MRKMKTLVVKMALALAAGLMLSACSSDQEASLGTDGKGAVQLSLMADMGFEAKTKAAVNEESYLTTRPIDNYTVKILDSSNGQLVAGCEWKYSEIPQGLIELKSGSYTVVAYDGEEFNKNASTREGIYMYGETPLTINSDQVEKKTVSCLPACGKLVVKFDSKMADHFSDYSVHFSTEAVGTNGSITWTNSDVDPLYVKLNKNGEKVKAAFSMITKAGKKVEVTPLNRDMKWGTMWTITVKPNVVNVTGNVGITITFDDSTNDKPIEIEIPSDWL